MRTATAVLTLALAQALLSPAVSQNNGGVFGPNVEPGHRSWDLRFAVTEAAAVQRTHVQWAFSDHLMGRVVLQARDAGPGSGPTPDFARADLFWDLGLVTTRWRTGLRFDAMVRNGAGPEQINLNWTNEVALPSRMTARFVLRSSHQFGGRGIDSPAIQTRAMIRRRLSNGASVGVEIYNPWGTVGEFGPFEGGRHQAGPFTTMRAGQIVLFAGLLGGLTDEAADLTARFRIVREF